MARKVLTLKQAEAEVGKHSETYRNYVKAQRERKDAKNAKETAAAQKKMDALRKGYTAYRGAYRDFLAAGGKKRSGKAAPKKNSGKGKGSRKVTTKQLSKAAMERRDPKNGNPDGLTQTQLENDSLTDEQREGGNA